jgi:hypothetical protein
MKIDDISEFLAVAANECQGDRSGHKPSRRYGQGQKADFLGTPRKRLAAGRSISRTLTPDYVSRRGKALPELNYLTLY